MKEEIENQTRPKDPYEDLISDGKKAKRLKFGVSVLAAMALVWLVYFLITGKHLFGEKTIGVVLFVFTGSLVEFRPMRNWKRRR